MDPTAALPKPFVFPVMKKAIEDLFTRPVIKKEDIEAFQDRYWEQLVPNFSQALKLLDIHGVPRHNILWNINDRLLDAIRSNIETKCESSDQKKCQKLWQKLIKTGMVYIHHPYMRSLIMQVLGKMNSIKERHVNLIMDNRYLYDDAPLPVLRHIWIAQPPKFKEELDRLFNRYQQGWSEALLDALSLSITATASSTSDLIPLLYWPPRRRRRCPAMVRIVEMIGDGQTLYDKAVQILRDECLSFERIAMEQSSCLFTPREIPPEATSTPPPKRRRRLNSSESVSDDNKSLFPDASSSTFFTSPAFLSHSSALTPAVLSTIRFDLLMSLNEAKIDRLCVSDRIHHFVWGLDACVRNRRIDQRHASGLAYRLRSQRQRAKKADSLSMEEQQQQPHRDVDTANSEDNSKRNLPSCRTKHTKSASSSSKHGSKRADSDEREPIDDACLSGKCTETEVLERDIHMACRDPWVVYTVCTSLIRYTINGLYEYKLPRDVPEVSLLVQFLLWAHGDDFNVIPLQKSTPRDKDHLSSKSYAKSADDMAANNLVPRALLGHILPAIAQLQVLVWKSQVAEEIVAKSNQIWPGNNPSTALASPSVTGGARRTSTSSGQEVRPEYDLPSAALQKQLSNASQATTVTVPSDYFIHPIGYLMLQYHALFALERGELAVLRALLRSAANLTQQQARACRLAGRSTQIKTCPGSPPKSPTLISGTQFNFRWRPEVLQALVLGLTRLPTSAPAFVEAGQAATRSVNSNSANLDSSREGTHVVPEPASTLDQNNSKAVSGTSDDSGPMGSSGSVEARITPLSLITRTELALLLKASLTLSNDLQLLALAQLALLLPGPQSSSSGTSNFPLLSYAEGTVSSDSLTDREKCIALISRHICSGATESDAELIGPESGQPSASIPTTTVGPFKSNDSRILLALDTLKKDVERGAVSSLTLSSSNLSTSKLSSNSLSTSLTPLQSGMTPHRGFQTDSTLLGNTPRSPTFAGKAIRPGAVFVRPNDRGPFYQSSQLLPAATPLTNPGLMGATPHVSSFGCNSSVPQTPCRPSTPPPEFRPASPMHTSRS